MLRRPNDPTPGSTNTALRREAAALLLVAAIVASAATACGTPEQQPFPEDGPRLMLFLVVDQFGHEYLQRLAPLLTGGLRYLLDNGVVFTDAHQHHANTVTAAGHATLSSGCYPSRSGIISNQWYDRDTGNQVYCVADRRYSRSPANLLVSTLGDWLKDRDPASKVFSAGGKDRSAILTGGHAADAALWFSAQGGRWVTSSYYDEPGWLEDFNDQRLLDRYFGAMWEPLPMTPEALSQAGILETDEGVYQRRLPYAMGSKSLAPNGSFYGAVNGTPFGDEYLMALAKAIIENEDLGADTHPDFLGVAFHALDYVGHDFGPNSREAVDTILRLDATLDELFRFVDERIGLDRVVISLSADHGAAPLPEYRLATGAWGARTDMDDIACYQQVGRQLADEYGGYDWLKVGLYLDDREIAAEGWDRAAIERRVAGLLSECDHVEKVWTRTELMESEPRADEPYRELFRNSYYPDRSPDFELQYEPFYLNKRPPGTTHGTPHEYDTWVPMIVAAPGIAPRRIADRVVTADMAPTLAAIMSIGVAGRDLDGTDRTPLMRSAERD